MSEGQMDVEEAIRIVIGTRINERLMRARFGSDVPALLFEPATSSTAGRLADAIRTSLARWEPRIDVLEVLVEPDPAEASRFVASLSYRLRENNSVLNLVYPFYLNEGTEEG
ncbi:MAG TPA: GPW/gp25 family protein [Polyangiaceae bacterium]|nr:GPW/gp25 family protein [Polyangiaceae bacterium]